MVKLVQMKPDWIKKFVVNIDNQVDDKMSKKKKYDEECFHENKDCKRSIKKNGVEDLGDEEFLLEEYEGEEEGGIGSFNSRRKASKFSVNSLSDEEEGESEGEGEEVKLKVYFCSRTHSQLSQFIKELRKTVFSNEMNTVSLGSRKNFCINEKVLRLGNSTLINGSCLELQKNKKKEISKVKNLGVEQKIRRTKAS
ncbi:hypothetical protein CRYUN_Cryun31cG0088700 [Craigia yunnanensis]